MGSPNVERATSALADRDPQEVRPAGEPDAFDSAPSRSHQVAPRRVHRRAGDDRRDERYRLTRPAAERLAERIVAYWAERGIEVRAWVERIDARDRADFVVRSTLTLRASPPEGRR